MKLVYICSPYAGGIDRNTELARAYCAAAVAEGALPVAPHIYLTTFLDDSDPKQREIGLQMGLKLLERCDELWLCTKQLSSGMKQELDYARKMGLTIRNRAQDWSCIMMGGADSCISTPQI